MYKYAQIIISISHKNIDKPFCYAVPTELREKIKIGMRVVVPFGRGNKSVEGYVLELTNSDDTPVDKLKEISTLLDLHPVFTEETLELVKWMSKKYYSTLADCMRCVMPAIMKSTGASSYSTKIKMVELNNENDEIEVLIDEILSKEGKQAEVLRLVMSQERISVIDIKAVLGVSDSPILTLEKKGLINIETQDIARDVYDMEKIPPKPAPKLTQEQERAIEKIKFCEENGEQTVLVHGVTGSGKTEVYMQIIADVIARGKQAIVLVPEISLTPQAVETFVQRFGANVTVTHSRLSVGERFDQWRKALNGHVSVMIGPRSAVFAPFKNLGVIIIDEEHEKTYKSEITPKYDAREVAEERERLTGCTVIYGSATPSVDTYYRTEKNEVALITLKERVNKKWPETVIVDMRKELADGNRSIFSNSLFAAVSNNLKKKEQSILFLNRRGHSTFVSCRQCGYVLSCEQCSVNYTYHMYSGNLICHYCGATEKMPQNCPVCGSTHIRYFGTGTQKIEDEIKQAFPQAVVLRMDMDTTSRKNSHEKIISAFRDGEADILVGTQMIAKGLNFANVSLVGIIAADITLNSGDYSAAETAYQLITQVSGRAGRAELDGTVYLQTYNPEHYSIQFAKESDYRKFYEHEISLRRQMNYPPFSKFFVILFTGTDEKAIIQALYRLSDLAKKYNRKGNFEMLGPAPAVISKIRKNFRWKLIVKGTDEELMKLFVFYCMDKLETMGGMSGISVNLTLNPGVIV